MTLDDLGGVEVSQQSSLEIGAWRMREEYSELVKFSSRRPFYRFGARKEGVGKGKEIRSRTSKPLQAAVVLRNK